MTTDVIGDVITAVTESTYDTCRLLHPLFYVDASYDALPPDGATQSTMLLYDVIDPPDDDDYDEFPVSDLTSVSARVKYLLLSVINPTLCVIGLVGNTLNIVVMTRRRMRSALDGRMERASRTGLVSLAVADMMCCVISLTMTAMGGIERTAFRSRDRFQMLVVAYGPYLQNAMLRASTWLTVVTAVGRYFAICRPLQTRHAAEPRTTRIGVAVAFVGSALMELPTAWTYRLLKLDCSHVLTRDSVTASGIDETDDMVYYLFDHGPFGADGLLRMISTVFVAVIGYLLPAAILSFCTTRLLAALRESVRITRCYHAHMYRRNTGNASVATGSARSRRLTVTLVAIVVFYLLLVSPSELVHMLYYVVQREHWRSADVVIDVANVLQTANFALNFVLYCAFNSQFRATWKQLFCPLLANGELTTIPGVNETAARRLTTSGRDGTAVRYDRHREQVVTHIRPASSVDRESASMQVDSRHPVVVVTFSRQEHSGSSPTPSKSMTTR